MYVQIVDDNYLHPLFANMTKAVVQEQDSGIIPHPLYSLDLDPSDFHVFCSLFNNLRMIFYGYEIILQKWLAEFMNIKTPDFFKRQ